MKLSSKRFVTNWNILLLFTVVFAAFIMPALPFMHNQAIVRIIYSLIFITAFFSLEKRTNALIILMLLSVVVEWLSVFFSMPVLHSALKLFRVVFFLTVVVLLIKQIAMSKNVNAEIILGALIGYILLGIIFSFFISLIMILDPGAFYSELQHIDSESIINDTSIPLYFSFVTMGTLGYGDILPVKPYTRAFASLITVAGQLYIAVIVALLVGKFSARK